ncbi:MAG: hypothetical protein M0D57_08215 [Sphingobacteriales bacterium JAD_PAG50586_3]|nr:MAG: hypothetical protein M0D57_08215 [Sphingobacteriales bacterium JAD_PAG50586_3]
MKNLQHAIIAVCVLAFYNNIYCQDTTTYKPWDKGMLLTFEDFKIIKNEVIKKGNCAITSAKFHYKINTDDINVVSLFNKKKSWIFTKCKDEYTLNHEQRHFDILEIYRRKLIKRIGAKK